MLDQLRDIVGPTHVLTGADAAPYTSDWTRKYPSDPLAVVRPASTAEVSAILGLAHETGTPVVPVSGRTGLCGGGQARGELMLSLERMNRIREIRPEARLAIVEAGVILSNLHAAADEHGLVFPMTFGAKGSAMIGGLIGTNAGGSNVVRYGQTRALCLGIEAVLADGRVMDLMTELHKDNSGYDLRDLMIGSEGTLGIVTAAVLKLVPKPAAYATAMVAVPALDQALSLLNRLQTETGGAVEAFEFMPREFMERHARMFPNAKPPLDTIHEVNILVEIGATAPRDATPGPDGSLPVVDHLQTLLAEMLEEGAVLDATVAQTEAQRRALWERREQAADIVFVKTPILNCDVSLPLDKVAAFLDRIGGEVRAIDPEATEHYVSHLGDGNVHYTVYPSGNDPDTHDAIVERVEDVIGDMGGSFSAEHGIGLSKKNSMARRKDRVALDVMRAIKAALDPKGILNPGKVLPD